MTDYRQLVACSDDELARVDSLVMNLLVAKSIPSLADLDIAHYQAMADQWAMTCGGGCQGRRRYSGGRPRTGRMT